MSYVNPVRSKYMRVIDGDYQSQWII